MEWLESLGGPLVAVLEAEVRLWRGVARNSPGDPSDYERACAVTEEIDIIQNGGSSVLVLGDEPHRTAWLTRDDGGLLVRWVHAESERAVETALREPLLNQLGRTGLFLHAAGPYRLIDAADPGDALTQGSLDLTIAPGKYEVLTGVVDAGRKVRLVVHALVSK